MLKRVLTALVIWTRLKVSSKYLKELLLSLTKLLSHITTKVNYSWCAKTTVPLVHRGVFKITSKMELLTKIANECLRGFWMSLWWNLLQTRFDVKNKCSNFPYANSCQFPFLISWISNQLAYKNFLQKCLN